MNDVPSTNSAIRMASGRVHRPMSKAMPTPNSMTTATAAATVGMGAPVLVM